LWDNTKVNLEGIWRELLGVYITVFEGLYVGIR
jgi:hypothetical protein